MTRYMLDTNILIYAGKQSNGPIREHFLTSQGLICTTTIVLSELSYGAEKSSDPERSRRVHNHMLRAVAVLDFDAAAAVEAGIIRNQLRASGTPIGPSDTLIAGHARSLGYTLITKNVREFSRVPELKIENWAER